MNTKYDFLVPDRVHDLTDRNTFQQRVWSMIPMVWATVFVFKKSKRAKQIFDMIKYVKDYYLYFVELYRIVARNYRNDYAFAIALRQLQGQIKTNDFISTPMNMLPHEYDVLDVDNNSVVYQYNKKVNVVTDTDVHVLDKEFVSV